MSGREGIEVDPRRRLGEYIFIYIYMYIYIYIYMYGEGV